MSPRAEATAPHGRPETRGDPLGRPLVEVEVTGTDDVFYIRVSKVRAHALIDQADDQLDVTKFLGAAIALIGVCACDDGTHVRKAP